MRTIYIQNTPIQIKDEECICNQILTSNRTRSIENQRLDITFIIGEKCNANCAFCCGPTDKLDSININKFKDFFEDCISQIQVRKITFTGGEPTLPIYFDKIQIIGKWIKTVSPSTDIIINTNGTKLSCLSNQDWITTIALSRHHYRSSLNDNLMKIFTADEVDIMMFDDKKKITLSCVCQKDYIDSGKELETYLRYASLMGIHTVGVYSLIPSTEYAKEAYVDPFDFNFSDSVLQYKTFDYPCENICQCKNFVYLNRNEDMNSVFFYMRKNINHLFNKGSYLVWKNNKINFF